ncbi:MAG TPA: hypothetical protein H9890_03325 [Candidatus Faecalibacterium intestinigallinarum]|uniref:Uncharacterized protein n=1 Tax=Candidatus Faecalibacterium intestinigallinarum TaxID=2838581 RepID=A0A9D1TVK7_9FIRM|nr:hypothetical protein [Candidatus Faecalibacterium intestinigallinarum]
MTKVEIIALAERWQTKADRAMERYQEDGLARHNREREQAQDLADALRVAANAADDHSELISLRGAVYCLAVKAHAAVDALDAPDRAGDRDILTDLARNVISTARLYGVDSGLTASHKPKTKEG